jgi:hypothetical protein
MSNTETARELRASAAAHDQASRDSFERCDTDGFLTQWAHDIGAQRDRLAADIADNGGVWTMPALFNLDGDWVPSKLIDGRYGTCWALVGDDGTFTGEFVSAFPVKASTMARKGFIEGTGTWPAKAVTGGGGTGLAGAANVSVYVVKACDDLTPPVDADPTPTNRKP